MFFFPNFFPSVINYVCMCRTKYKSWVFVCWLCSWSHPTWPLSLRCALIPGSYQEYNSDQQRKGKHMRLTSFSQTSSEDTQRRILAWWSAKVHLIQHLFSRQSSFATHATSSDLHVPSTVTFATVVFGALTITASGSAHASATGITPLFSPM